MRIERVFLVVALVLGLGGIVYAYATSPTRLTVAVGPADLSDHRLMQAFAEQLKAQRVAIRLRVIPVTDMREAAQIMERGGADLAVVRPDVANPQNGLTLAILRDASAILLTPTASKVTELSDLDGRKLGVVTGHEADPNFIGTVLRHFDLDAPSVAVVPIARDRAIAALKAKQIDAVALVAPPTSPFASDFVRDAAREFNGKLAIIPIENADAIAQRSLVLSQSTIPEGIWGGRPKQPDREIKTVGVSYRLMARSDLDRSVVALLTESLFQMRSRLAVESRSADLMRPPETDPTTSATLPNHPGAVDYFQREQQSVMDRYGDWIYLLAFFGSGLASIAAWLGQRFRRQRREQIDDVLDRLLAILADARAAETGVRLDEITVEIDALLAVAVGHARTGTTSSRATNAIALAMDGARAAVADRRRQIEMPNAAALAARRDSVPRLVTLT